MRKFYQTTITLILVFAAGILSATEIGTNVKVGTNANSARFPQITYCSSENKFLLVWNGNESGYDRIYYNFLDEAEVSGTPSSTGALLSASSTGTFRYSEKPQVAYDSSTGTAAVVWQESNALGKDSVVLSILNVNSESESTEVVVADNSTWNMSATVASNNMGKYLVAYYDTTSLSITGKFYNSSGVQVGSDLLLGSVGSAYLFPYSIDIAYNSINDVFTVVWADYFSNMFSTLVKSDGTIVGSNDYSSISAVGNPAIAYNDLLNNFLIVYDDFSGNVSGVVVDSVGVLTGESYSFGNSSVLEAEPDVAYNSLNAVFAITWTEYLGDPGIWLQELYIGEGSFKSDSFKIDDATSTSNSPALAYGSSDESYWVTWFGEDEGKDQIYLQRYHSDIKLVNAISRDITVRLNDSGFYVLSANEIDSASIAIGGTPVLSIDRDTLWCSDVPSVSVMLVVSNSSGISDTSYATVTIRDTLSIECQGDQFEFVNSNCEYEIPDYVAEATITSSCDIDTLIQTPEAGSFVRAGDTTITITVKAGSLISDCSFNLNVTGVSSDFTSDLVSGCKGTKISFTDLSSENVISWLWDFGDGSPLDSTQNPSHVYTEPGDYTVSLKVNNAIGCADSISKEAYITIYPPLARFSANPTFGLTTPHTVFFTDQSTLPDTWFWDFGDGFTSTAQNPIHSYTAFGSYKVLLTVTDTIYGCSDTVSTIVNVAQDTTPPEINCLPDTFLYTNDNSCERVLGDYTSIVNVIDDYDSSPNVEQFPAPGTFFRDSVLVTIKATDFSSNTDSCSFWITVLDTISPEVITRNITVYLEAGGSATISPSMVDNGSYDACGIFAMRLDTTYFDCSSIGEHVLTLTVEDVNGNVSESSVLVTVVDEEGPVTIIKNVDVYLGPDGTAEIDVSTVDNGTYDDCGISEMMLDQTFFDCSNLGDNLVTLTTYDHYFNSSYAQAWVTVIDSFGPEVSTQDITAYLDETGHVELNAAMADNGSFDACGISDMWLSQRIFNCEAVGTQILWLSVEDIHGNISRGSLELTVLDTISPVVLCKRDTVYLDESGIGLLSASDIDNGSFDACGITTMSLSRSVFSGTDIGDNVVELTATDGSGNSGWCQSAIVVLDTISPDIWCQDTVILLDADGYAHLDSISVLDSVYDAVGIAIYELDRQTFDCSDIGENTVRLRVTDPSGNSSVCESTVSVLDEVPPAVLCKDYELLVGEEGIAELSPWMIDGGSTDACGIAAIRLSKDTFDFSDVGETYVELIVSDVNGNEDSCQAKVLVTDGAAPEVVCNPITVELFTGTYRLTEEDLAKLSAGSNDAVSPVDSLIVEVSPNSFSCEDIGDSVLVTVSISDQAGNTAVCETKVYVDFPVIEELADVETTLAAGSCEGTVDYPEIFTLETCATMTLVEGLGVDGVFPLGTTKETWTITAGSITDTVSFNVEVKAENALPILDSVADVAANEDVAYVMQLTGISDGGDCVAQKLSVTAASADSDLIADIAVDYTSPGSTAQLSITFVANESGEAEIVVLVEDEVGAAITDTFTITVNPVNDSPVLVEPLADQEVRAGSTLELVLNKTLGVLFDDIDNDELNWSATLLEADTIPSWTSIDETAEDYVIGFSPAESDTGCYSIEVTVQDADGAEATDTFEVCITSIPVGIEEIGTTNFEVKMYPNPTRGKVNIEYGEIGFENVEIVVHSASGGEVFRKEYGAGEAIRFDLSGEVSGMYLVIIRQGDRQISKKLILDRK